MSPPIDRYVAIGDSFSAGTDSDRVAWPELTARALRERGDSVELHNFAKVGATCAAVVEEQLDRTLELKPDIVTVICGANDVLLSVRPDVEAFAECFKGLLERLRGELPDATLITATYPDPGRFADLGPRTRKRVVEGIEQVNAAIRDAAEANGVLCLALSEHPGVADPTNVGKDGFHPSPVGHRRASQAVLQAIVEQEPDASEKERECA
jgi:lysophospholipase L1-like esterase